MAFDLGWKERNRTLQLDHRGVKRYISYSDLYALKYRVQNVGEKGGNNGKSEQKSKFSEWL